MQEPFEFSTYIGTMCAKKGLDAHELGKTLGVDSKELLDMINGKKLPSKAVVHGLAKELDVDVR